MRHAVRRAEVCTDETETTTLTLTLTATVVHVAVAVNDHVNANDYNSANKCARGAALRFWTAAKNSPRLCDPKARYNAFT
jgi:hypothetical protein